MSNRPKNERLIRNMKANLRDGRIFLVLLDALAFFYQRIEIHFYAWRAAQLERELSALVNCCKEISSRLSEPLYAELLGRVLIKNSSRINGSPLATAAILRDGEKGFILLINYRWFKKLSKKQQEFIIVHELKHILMGHLNQSPKGNNKDYTLEQLIEFDREVNRSLDPLIVKKLYGVKSDGTF